MQQQPKKPSKISQQLMSKYLEQNSQFEPAYDKMASHFAPLGKPKPGEWLATQKEKGQTMEQYLERNTPIMRPPNTIYLLPLEQDISQALTQRLERIIRGFYCTMQVKLLAPIPITKFKVQSRTNNGVLQYHAGQILDQIRTIKPKDAFCLVGYMIADIYPRDEWNFVFGLADPDISTGVFSFARYHESFYGGTKFPDYEGRDNFCQVTFRACAVLVHEIGHLFDLRHCISFKCAMNGSNSLEETAGKPFLFCPHCLRKIVFKIKTTPEALLKSFHQATIDIGEGPFLELAEQLNKLLKAIQ